MRFPYFRNRILVSFAVFALIAFCLLQFIEFRLYKTETRKYNGLLLLFKTTQNVTSKSNGGGGGRTDVADDDDVIEDGRGAVYDALFDERRRHAYEKCVARNQTKFLDKRHVPYNLLSYKFLFVDEKHKLLFCNVPKVASTNWKKLLLILSDSPEAVNYTKPEDIEDDDINVDAFNFTKWSNFKPLVRYNKTAAAERIRNYTKVIWVRDPYRRLVSAWRSKFFGPNPYYNIIGRYIIAKYRKNANSFDKANGWPISFEEFLRYVHDRGLEHKHDVHWSVMSQLCLFCEIRYDYIGRYETLMPEAEYLLHHKLAPGRHTYPSFPSKSHRQELMKMSQNNHKELINAAPKTLLNETLKIFQADFDIFGYDKPVF